MDSDLEENKRLGGCVKLLEEKHAPNEIKSMIWSPKMDLVGTITHGQPSEVVLFRLHALKKVWSHKAAPESEIVDISWDPSGQSKKPFGNSTLSTCCNLS